MSERWTAEMFESAARVPVWTRPQVGRFAAFAAGEAPRFSAWDSPAPEPVSETPAPDPRIAIEAEAFARGFQEGYAAASATLSDDQGATARLVDALDALRPKAASDLAPLLAETVSRLVRQIVGEVTVDSDRLADRIRGIVAVIEEDGGPARLRLHPADIARIDGFTPPLPILADPSLAEGTIVAEGSQGWVEDGPAIRMERLRQALDAMASAR